MRKFLVFDIGATFIKYGILNEKGDIIKSELVETEAKSGGQKVIEKVKLIGSDLLKTYIVDGVCISTAGQVDSKQGKIIYASELIPQYTGMTLKYDLEEYFNLPVEVENDVNCVGLAESWLGKGKDVDSLFCLTIGSGIGGSYILNNKLHTGHNYSGGEIGYIPMDGSEFQELASTRTLIRRVAQRKNINETDLNGKKIFELAKQGDQVCIDEINRMVYYLSKGIATIAYMMNPEVIVIGGGITKQKYYLLNMIVNQLKKDLLLSILKTTKLEIATNFNEAGMIGAVRHFLLKESFRPYNRLITLIESNKKRLTKGETLLSNHILRNIIDVPTTTISELAEKTNVSESMITRFCKKLNIRSFSELRLLAKEMTFGDRLYEKSTHNRVNEITSTYYNIFQSIETLNEKLHLESLVQDVAKKDKLFIYTPQKLANIGQIIKLKLMKLGINTNVYIDDYEMTLSERFLNENVIVIGVSLTGYDTNVEKILLKSKAKGSLTIGITSQQNSPITNVVDKSIFIVSDEHINNELNFAIELSIIYLFDLLFNEMKTSLYN